MVSPDDVGINRLVVGSNPTSGAKSEMMSQTWRVYVLRNLDGKLYIGISGDVRRRVDQHNLGGSEWTRDKGPWHCIWTSEALSLSKARKLENKLKRQKGGDGFFSITGVSRQVRAVNPASAGS
jgi:predicted GIY-YIG superfamily endonuclease